MTAEALTVVCPSCDGNQTTLVHVNTKDPTTHGLRWMACSTCGGVGKVSEDHLRRMGIGRKLREDRRARGLSLMQEAERLGISVVELSNMERGRVA